MTVAAADLQLAVANLLSAAIQIGIGVVVLGVVVLAIYLVLRGALRP